MTSKTPILPSASTPQTSETANKCKKTLIIDICSDTASNISASDNITTSNAILDTSSPANSEIEATTGVFYL